MKDEVVMIDGIKTGTLEKEVVDDSGHGGFKETTMIKWAVDDSDKEGESNEQKRMRIGGMISGRSQSDQDTEQENMKTYLLVKVVPTFV